MKASELRIGNYINRPDLGDSHIRTESVLAIYERVKTSGPIKTIFDFEDITPIPLTEDWLLKFGCKKNEDTDNFWNQEKDFSVEVEYVRSDNGVQPLFYYNLSINRKKHLVYVHQLQNLYFALTGEELTLKP